MTTVTLPEPSLHDDPFTQVVYAEETLWAVLRMLDELYFAPDGERSEIVHNTKKTVWNALNSVMNAKELLKGR